VVQPDDTPPLAGALQLPDGTWVRGRALRRPLPAGPQPDFGLYLGVDHQPPWEHQHLDWPDFWLPRAPQAAARALQEAYDRARAGAGVEVACPGGRGRTGTALAAISVLAGTPADQAVAWVRERYDRHAVETPWQRRWVRRFPDLLAGA
jgi:Protein-tyrosine phosphatase